MRATMALMIAVVVIPFLLLVVWLTDPSTHPIVLATSSAGVFVALGIFRALKLIPQAESTALKKTTLLMCWIVGPLIAGGFSVVFPKLIAPIVVTVMCIVSLVSLLIRDRV
jgi:hypothetical protein